MKKMEPSRAEQEKSLGTGLSLPQWMKGRIDNRYDFDQSSFSPPSHDDSFFYIRYSKTSSEESEKKSGCSGNEQQRETAGYRPISQVLSSDKTTTTSGEGNSGTAISSNIRDVRSIDFSKHPLPCQPFVPTMGEKNIKPAASKMTTTTTMVTMSTSGGTTNKIKSVKSQGTDDGFHGEPALCGKSIVNVANRMMFKKIIEKNSTNQNNTAQMDSKSSQLEPHQEDELYGKISKSLPVTPITSPISTPDTSPKSRRKIHTNRYFTGAFIPDREKYPAGWILSSFLGQSRDTVTTNNNKIQEETANDEEVAPSFDLIPSKFLNRKKSISSQNLSYIGGTSPVSSQQQQPSVSRQSKETTVYTNVLHAKPSELREMNFWSPTSM